MNGGGILGLCVCYTLTEEVIHVQTPRRETTRNASVQNTVCNDLENTYIYFE